MRAAAGSGGFCFAGVGGMVFEDPDPFSACLLVDYRKLRMYGAPSVLPHNGVEKLLDNFSTFPVTIALLINVTVMLLYKGFRLGMYHSIYIPANSQLKFLLKMFCPHYCSVQLWVRN